MDNNMIKIDDLVRNKLQGAEEEPRAGAWQGMRSLLDKEMPIGQARPSRGGVWFKSLMVIALLGAASVGGYRMSKQYFADNTQQPIMVPDANPIQSAESELDVALAKAESSKQLLPSAQTNEKQTSSETDVASDTRQNRIFNKNQTVNNTNPPQLNTTTAPERTQPIEQIVAPDQAKDIASNTVSSAKNALPQITADLKIKEEKLAFQQEVVQAETVSFNEQIDLPKMTKVEPEASVKDRYRLQMDTIVKLVTSMKYIASKKDPYQYIRKIDTLELGDIVMMQWILNEPKTKSVTASAQPVAPAAVAPDLSQLFATSEEMRTTAGEANLVQLNTQKTNSKKLENWNSYRWRKSVDQFKYTLGQLQFFTGMTAGINAVFPQNGSLFGFHAGLTETVKFNEKWSLMAELNYQQQFNTGYTLHDPIRKTTHVDSDFYYVGNKLFKAYSAKTDSVDRAYKFSTVQNLNLPLILTYSFKRFNLMGGVNLKYTFPISVEETGNTYTLLKKDTVLAGSNISFANRSMQGKVNPTDFRSQFGVGYIFGVSYQTTPATSIDLRVSNSFWTNASGTGEKEVANSLLKRPNVQLSLGYRFGKKIQKK
ncbi:MAG TPA: outer membrane beta-barrel protein [Aquaticitalea sp.]|nr:outer membrane beta-barrel protein [Aquaticitalea sp.]